MQLGATSTVINWNPNELPLTAPISLTQTAAERHRCSEDKQFLLASKQMCHFAKEMPYSMHVCYRHLGMGEHLLRVDAEMTKRPVSEIEPMYTVQFSASIRAFQISWAAIPWSLPGAVDSSAKVNGRIAVGWVAQDCHWTLDTAGEAVSAPNWQWIGRFRHIGRTIVTSCPRRRECKFLLCLKCFEGILEAPGCGTGFKLHLAWEAGKNWMPYRLIEYTKIMTSRRPLKPMVWFPMLITAFQADNH